MKYTGIVLMVIVTMVAGCNKDKSIVSDTGTKSEYNRNWIIPENKNMIAVNQSLAYAEQILFMHNAEDITMAISTTPRPKESVEVLLKSYQLPDKTFLQFYCEAPKNTDKYQIQSIAIGKKATEYTDKRDRRNNLEGVREFDIRKYLK